MLKIKDKERGRKMKLNKDIDGVITNDNTKM